MGESGVGWRAATLAVKSVVTVSPASCSSTPSSSVSSALPSGCCARSSQRNMRPNLAVPVLDCRVLSSPRKGFEPCSAMVASVAPGSGPTAS